MYECVINYKINYDIYFYTKKIKNMNTNLVNIKFV